MSGVSAIICEFDPLHAGHRRVIGEAAEKDGVTVAVMSGNFTQRSSCALFDKYSRAEAAVRCGCDLVLELPFPWSCCSAEFFALGGVSVALSAGADRLVFGSECADVGRLENAASFSESDGFRKAVASADPAAGAARTVDELFREAGFEIGKNDKLALEYIKTADRLSGGRVSFKAVKRIPSSPDGHVSSSEIRDAVRAGGLASAEALIDPDAFAVYGGALSADPRKLTEIEFYGFRLFRNGGDAHDAGGGVFSHLCRAAEECPDPDDFLCRAATKKYTDSRLRRAALFSTLGVVREDVARRPGFTVLLGASEKGRAYLRTLDPSPFVILTKPSDTDSIPPEYSRSLDLLRRADELYSVCVSPGAPAGRFIRKSPYVEQNG